MDKIIYLSKTSPGQVFTISDKINLSFTSLHQNKDVSASHLYTSWSVPPPVKVTSFETLRTLELSLKSHLHYRKNEVQIY